ncbi:unnamed protein product [Periconia digitata]|uniref:Uncharacterized protein n=1 Tax=Periconia digitata TaxID=1303443 RepID=A0A9W4XRE7_9PLEO|nr:unnamed protein product [Periconia digitata]
MTPNLFVATQTLFQPKKWFRQSKIEKPQRKTERWSEPVPGLYEYIPGRGWYLIEKDKISATDQDASDDSKEGGPVLSIKETASSVDTIKVQPPIAVRYSKVLKRFLLSPDYDVRKKHGDIESSQGAKLLHVGFFRLDDEVSWVNCWDENGEFIPGPYRLWFYDTRTQQFRHMLRRDDPVYQRSHPGSRAQSRQNSFDREQVVRRHSQESRSTEYKAGPGSTRDGQSMPSSRATSVYVQSKPTSKAPSQANSRRGSFSRGQPSPRIPLDEAGAALKMLQKERAERERAAVEKSSGSTTNEVSSSKKTAEAPMPSSGNPEAQRIVQNSTVAEVPPVK